MVYSTVIVNDAMSEKKSEILGYATLLQEVKGTDSKTGLLTRANLYKQLIRDLARCERYGNKLSIASMRVVGDKEELSQKDTAELMDELGNELAARVRTVDCAARWSEHDFLVVLPETDAEGARLFLNKVEAIMNESLKQSAHSKLRVKTEIAGWEKGFDMPVILSKVGL